MARRLLLVALGAAAAAVVISSRRKARSVGDASGNGGSHGRVHDLRRLVGHAREQIRSSNR